MPSPSRRSLTAPYAWPASDALLSDWKRAERPLLNTADDHAVPPRRGADRRLRIVGWGTKLATHREIRLPAAQTSQPCSTIFQPARGRSFRRWPTSLTHPPGKTGPEDPRRARRARQHPYGQVSRRAQCRQWCTEVPFERGKNVGLLHQSDRAERRLRIAGPGAKLATQREIRLRAARLASRRFASFGGAGATRSGWEAAAGAGGCSRVGAGRRRRVSWAIWCRPGGFGEVFDPVQGRPHRLLAAPVTVAHEPVFGEPGGEGQPDDLE